MQYADPLDGVRRAQIGQRRRQQIGGADIDNPGGHIGPLQVASDAHKVKRLVSALYAGKNADEQLRTINEARQKGKPAALVRPVFDIFLGIER